MNTDDSISNEAVWACLHGELTPEARATLEQQLAASPALRRRFDAAQRLDRLLRHALPARGADAATDDALTEQALAAWEREQAVRDAPTFGTWDVFLRRAAVGLSGLAAAAALALAVSPMLRTPGGVRWSDPAFTPVLLRGDGNASDHVTLTPASARQCRDVLRDALAQAIQARGAAVPAATLSLRLQELRQGAFSVAVTARGPAGRTLAEWRGDYSGMQAFLSRADASAAALADALATLAESEKRP
jgi:hypothetical protein